MSLAEWAFGRLIVVIVAASTVTAVGVGTVTFFIGRHSVDSSPEASVSAGTEPAAPSAQASAAPTAVVPTPDDVPTPTGEAGPVGAPTRVNEFGVPVGYPHTKSGAISACGNYVAVTSVAKNREPTRSHDIILSISDENTAARLSNLLSQVDTETAKNFNIPSVLSPQFTLNHRVIGYKITSYGENVSKVEVLSAIAAGVTDGTPNLQPSMHWGTDLCTINWDGSDWKLRDISGGSEGHAMTERSSESFERFALAGVTS
ncbi:MULTISPECIES: hypothetical protein [Parafrankia]|uniref:hypothetical protein n=1 Tax=Parafrankia TaxID=2994362 RepID=UPI001F60FAC2|nr:MULTISPECIES: hypothetical protein [Parafrankia]